MTHIFLRAVAIICGLMLASGIAADRGYGQTYGIDFRNTLMPASGYSSPPTLSTSTGGARRSSRTSTGASG